MSRPEYLYLREMRDAISRIIALIDEAPVGSDLGDDWVKTDALSWNFTILGEAAAKLPEEFRAGHPEIIWRRPIGLRNRVVRSQSDDTARPVSLGRCLESSCAKSTR